MRPRLIHPRDVVLHRYDTQEFDTFGDPVDESPQSSEITLKGQVAYAKYDALNLPGGGNDPLGDGHVIFDAEVWDGSGGKVGDELQLSPSESRLFVVEVQPCGHYGGIAWQRKVIFSRKRATARG